MSIQVLCVFKVIVYKVSIYMMIMWATKPQIHSSVTLPLTSCTVQGMQQSASPWWRAMPW